MERTMRRFKEAMSSTIPPSFVIETKTKRKIPKSQPKSFSIGSGQVQRRLFRKNVVLLKETTNANSATILAKGTLCDKAEKENQHQQQTASLSSASFDLELDDSDYDYERIDNSILHNSYLVDELSHSDESDISSIGVPAEFATSHKSSRLLLTASFPSTPARSVATNTTTETPSRERNDDVEQRQFSLWMTTNNNATMTTTTTNTLMQQARSKMALGHTHLQRKDYTAAKTVLLEASQLYEEIHGPNHTSVALALDAHALACLKLSQTQEGLAALERAFAIRSHSLGVWHVDTADTYNKIGSVHLQMGNAKKALAAYQEVLQVRKAILGPHHPSVAITAHALAKVHVQLGNPVHAQAHFDLAKSIYEQLGMRHHHKDMQCLLKDEHWANGNGVPESSAEF